MVKKLQSFVIFKLSSSRIKNENYKINLSLYDARKNQETVRVGDSQLLTVVRRITKNVFSKENLEKLQSEKKIFSKQNKREDVLRLMKEIDEMLFIDSVVEIKFDNKKHYQHIIEKGLFINDLKYVRLLAGSGNLRRNVVFFIKESLYEDVINILENNRNKTVKLNPAKFGAYMGLYNSSGYKVTFPKLCVVNDYEFKIKTTVDWVNDNNSIEEKNMDIPINGFDGQGIISVELAKVWAKDLGLDYIPSSFVFRSPFAKGQVVVFDIQSFSRDLAQTSNIVDAWGNNVDCRDFNLFISKSQLKLWQTYSDCDDYVSSCKNNELDFWVSKYSSKNLKTHAYTNYMFLQVLNLSDEDIKNFCNPTIEYFKSLLGSGRNEMLIYSNPTIKDKININEIDATNLSLMINPEFLKEPHIIAKYNNSLKKKFKESYLGNLLVDGNFQPIISDPYAQCEFIFGLDVYGLLQSDEHYCDYWNKKNITEVASGRSPLTHQSEMNLSKLVNRKSHQFWYKYINNGFIISPKGIDTFLWADSDQDGDLIFTTNNEYIIKGRQPGNPISYEKRSAEKRTIDLDELWKYDILAFNSKVGFITNVTSTYHCMLSDFKKGSKEYTELQSRLKILRLLQGECIDSAKNGGVGKQIPEYWVKKINKNSDAFSEEEIEFYNSLVANKRPEFMRHLYSHYNKKFNQQVERRNRKRTEVGKLENETLYDFIENDCIMNKIERYMMENLIQTKKDLKLENSFNYYVLLNDVRDDFDLCLAERINKKYLSLKKTMFNGSFSKDAIKDFSINLEKEMLENGKTMDDIFNSLVIYLYQKKKTDKTEILWECFPDKIIERIKKDDFVFVPMEKPDGDIDYLGKKYSIGKVNLYE